MKRSAICLSVNFLILGFVILLSSCSQDAPLQAINADSDYMNAGQMGTTLEIGIDDRALINMDSICQLTDIQSVSHTVYFNQQKNKYFGTSFGHPNGSSFIVEQYSLTPPVDHEWGENMQISMHVQKDLSTGQLIYTFGPSGCSFEPAAELWICWKDLGTESATLYYIDKDDQFIEQIPDFIDYSTKRLKIKINHFSRYAVAYSD